MKAILNGAIVMLRQGISLEIWANEPISFPDSNELQIVSAPSDDGSTLIERTLRVTAVGRYNLTLKSERTGDLYDVTLVCCEPALLPFVEAQLRSLGHGGELPSPERARRVVRSLAQTEWFTGRIDDTTAHPSRSIVHHGA